MGNEKSIYMTKSEKVKFIAGGVSGFVLVNFSGKILYAFMNCKPGLAHVDSGLRILGHIFLAVSFAFAISRYISHARIAGLTKRKIAIITSLLILPVILLALNYATYSSTKGFYQYMDATLSKSDGDLVNKIDVTPPGEKKSRMTYVHAQSVYRDKGDIIEYQSPTGTSILYAPDKEDMEVRCSIAYLQTHSRSLNYVMISSSIAYLLSFLGMLYFGFRSEGPTSGSSPTRA
jgi:hypothetical protein